MADNKFSDFDAAFGANQTSASTQARPEAVAQNGFRSASGLSSRRGLGGINGSLLRTIARNPTSQVVADAVTAMRNIPDLQDTKAKALLENGDIGFLPFDGTATSNRISAVIVCRKASNNVAAMVVPLAATAGDLGDTVIDGSARNAAGLGQISIPVVPSDIYTTSKQFIKDLEMTVREAYPAVEAVVLIGQMVLQAEVNSSDSEQVRPLVYRSLEALESYLYAEGWLKDRHPYSLTDLMNDETLVVRPVFGQPEGKDDLGNPRREDIRVDTFVRQRVRDSDIAGNNQYYTQVQSTTRGYMDVTYVGASEEIQPGDQWTKNNMQTFIPVFVITDLDSGTNAVELPQLLLAISSCTMLSQQNRWVAAFNPQYARGNDGRFVGGLGHELPQPGTKVGDMQLMGPVKNDSTFSYTEFVRSAFYFGSMNVVIDIEDAGAISSLQETLVSAACGHGPAVDAIVAAADELTGGRFSHVWQAQGHPVMFTFDDTRIPLGYYIDENGHKRDCRNLDTLALYNYGVDLPTVQAYDEAIYNPSSCNGDPMRRLMAIISQQNLANSTFRITSYARRIAVTPAFIDCLFEAIRACNVTMDIDGNFDITYAQARGNRRLLERGLGANINYAFQPRGGYHGSKEGFRYNSQTTVRY